MPGRKPKITTDPADRADQRERTAQMMAASADMQPLQQTPPRYLKGVALASWRELWPVLTAAGLVKQADKTIIASLCEQLAVKRAAYDNIAERGVIVGGKKNPACQVLNDATAKVKTLSDALGLSPQARATIMGGAPPEGDDDPEAIIAAMKHKEGDDEW